MQGQTGEKGQDNRYGNQNDNNPLQNFHAPRGSLIGDFFIDTFHGVQFAHDAGIPLGEVETLRGEVIDAGQVLIPEEFEGIVDAFKEHGTIHLHLRHTPQVGGG